jgi:hypothetical protein
VAVSFRFCLWGYLTLYFVIAMAAHSVKSAPYTEFEPDTPEHQIGKKGGLFSFFPP